MNNIKIGPKLIASFLFIAAITAFMGIYMAMSLKNLNKQTNLIYERGAVPLGMLVHTIEQSQEMRLRLREWRIVKTDDERATSMKAIEKSHTLIKELIAKQREQVIFEEGKKYLDNLQIAIDRFKEEVHIYTRGVTSFCPLSGMVSANFPFSLLDAEAEMFKASEAAIERRIISTEKISKESLEIANHDSVVAITILIVVLLFSISIGIFLTLSITHPLSVVVDTLSKIEKGDMTNHIGLKRKDELGILSNALDNLSVRFRHIFKNLHKDSDAIASSSEELSSVGKQVTSTAEENVSQSATIASATEQASTNMNMIAAAMEEMSASISQISNNAGETRNIAGEATNKSCEATGAMNKLGTAAKEIGHVTNMIKKIADKTNLLALNATIEAASAGEAGKGFAVVAGEIKELANQSSQSADDIAQRIKSIQVGTSEAVIVINDVSEIITKMNQSVEAISSHVNQQTKASNEIAYNISEAAKGSSVISRSVAGMAQGARDNADGAKQINQAAGELAKLASDSKNLLGQFKV